MLEPTPQTSVAIVGAGWLGQAVARALPGPVLATTRSGQWRDGSRPPNVTVAALDLTTGQSTPAGVLAAEAIVIAVAPGRGARRTDPEAQDARNALYVDGTRALLTAVPTGKRVIFIGSTSALPDHDAWLSESCPDLPETARGRTQRAAEAVVLGYEGRPVVLRMGGLYGPGRELQRLYRNRDPEAPRPGDGMAPTNLVHQLDAVAAVVAAIARPNVRGIVHVVADGHPPRRTMYAQIAAQSGVAAPTWSRPVRDPVPHGKRVSNVRLKLDLGVALQRPWPFR